MEGAVATDPGRLVSVKLKPLGRAQTFHLDAPGEVGADFAAAIQLAKEVGFTSCRRFAGRKKTNVALV